MAAAQYHHNSSSLGNLAVDIQEFIPHQAVARVEWQVLMLARVASLSLATIACSNHKCLSKAYRCQPHLRVVEWARLQSHN